MCHHVAVVYSHSTYASQINVYSNAAIFSYSCLNLYLMCMHAFVHGCMHVCVCPWSSHLITVYTQLFILRSVDVNLGAFVIFLFINGALINGPYGLIGAAVSSDLVRGHAFT